MSQVAVISKGSVFDWFGQPAPPANPPAGQARMFYNSFDNTFHVIDANGVELLSSGGGTVASVFGRTGAVVATSGDYTVGQITGAAPIASPVFSGTATTPLLAVTTGANAIRVGAPGSPTISSGAGTPEGTISAPVGSIYFNSTGTTATSLWVKQAGSTGPTGWGAVTGV